jgi:hypothetical protein
MTCVLRVRYGVWRKPALQCADEEEPQCRNLADNCFCLQLSSVEKVGLILADVVRAELIGPLVEETREPLDSTDVSAYSCLRRSYVAGVPPA